MMYDLQVLMLSVVLHHQSLLAWLPIEKQYSSVSSMTIELCTDVQFCRYRCSGRCIHAILVVLGSGGSRGGRGVGREVCPEGRGQMQCKVYNLLSLQVGYHTIPLDSSALSYMMLQDRPVLLQMHVLTWMCASSSWGPA